MKNLEIDIETYSSVSLQKCGVYKYAEADDFEILLFGYSVDCGEVKVIDLACGEEIPAELLEAGNDQNLIEEIGDAIINLREERQSILTEAALKHDLQERMEDLISFLDEQTEAIAEYCEALARRLIEKITVYDEKLVVEFKSGLTVEVET